MTSPHPFDSHSAPDRSSASSTSNPHPSNTSSSRRGVTPISTTFGGGASHKILTSSSQSPRNPWSQSPAPNAASTGPSSILSRNATRSSSISTSTSPFPPPQGPSAGPPPGLSSRARTATSGSTASATSAGAPSAATRLSRASPSLSHGSPPATAAGADPSTGSVSSIVIAQVTVLLSSLKEKDKDKWESQVDQLRKLVDTHGMDVFTKYFRRLILSNTSQIWHNSRNFENGTYRVLEGEVQKITTDPFQASKVVEAIEHGEKDGEVFRDFDLSGFLDHFKVKTVGKVALAAAFKKSSKTDLRTKSDAILHSNLNQFIATIASPTTPEALNEPSQAVLASIIAHLAQHPPRNWSAEILQNFDLAVRRRYTDITRPVPLEISSTILLFDIVNPNNHLVRALQKSGTRGTDNVDRCRSVLETVELHDINYEQVANALLFMAYVNAVEESGYNPPVFISALREHRGGQRLDWLDVLHAFDREGIKVTKKQFKVIYDALLPLAQEYENFDLQLLWGGHWRHQEAQLTFVSAFLSCSHDELDASRIPRLRKAFAIEDFQDASAEIQAYAAEAVRHPLCSLDATEALFSMVFRSSETYSHAQNLGVVENVINYRMNIFVAAVSAVQKPWGPLQDQAIKQLLDTLLVNNIEGNDFVFHILWKRDSNWMLVRLRQFWQQNPRNLERILEHARAHDWLDSLINAKDDLSVELAALAHGRGVFDLDQWLEELYEGLPAQKVVNTFSMWLKSKASEEILIHREQAEVGAPSLQVKTVHAVLRFLGEAGLHEDQLIILQRECIQAYPRLINYGEGFDDIIDANNQAGNELPAEADAKMQEHYKHMYNSESQVRDVVESLTRYKVSREPQEQDLFACMIYGLFDEYNCFPEYPTEALAITAVLFGSIINYNLLSRIALKAALSMVLESVRDHEPGESMYRFGLQALLHFRDRLSEWKMFSERLLAVPGLKGSEIEPVIERVVRENAEGVNGDGQERSQGGEGTVDEIFANEARIPEFTCLAVDNPERTDYAEPEESIKENVLFTLNNLSDRNLSTKFPELREGLQPQHNQWLANYLIDQRVKSQPNFQKLYMDLLDHFGDKELWAEILRETFLSSFRLLNAEATATNASERQSLRNMADWLGSVTIARNRPIRHRNISFKDLLIEAHDTNRLPLAVPFTCRVLTKAAESRVFKPPCAWTTEILEILVELHRFVDMKVQHKFEIEKLLNDLGVDGQTIEPSSAVRDRPAPEEASLIVAGSVPAEGLGDGNQIGYARGPTDRYSPATIMPELNDVGSMLKHNYNPSHANSNAQHRVRQLLVRAVERALTEIISPVVDRSVTIAAISASQLISKDFATEPEADRYQEASHNLVRNLAGSLALVTCREPLRTGISSNIRNMLSAELGEQALSEGAILMFVNDNLDQVCSLVEKAAENVSTNEIDYYIEPAIQVRKSGNFSSESTVNRWSHHVPEPFKPSHGGLNREQMALYEDFGRALRGNISHNINVSQDAGRQLPDVLQDQFNSIAAMPNNHNDPPPMLQRGLQHPSNPMLANQARPAQPLVNGYSDQQSLAEKAQQLSLEMIRAATAAADEYPDQDLSNLGQVHGAWRRVQGLVFSSGQVSQQDQISLLIAERIAQVVSQEVFAPNATDVLARVIRLLCEGSEMTMREVCTWLRASEERLYNAVTTIAFLKSDLLEYDYVDKLVAAGMAQGRVETVALFGKLADGLLFNEPPAAFRAEFVHSMTALGKWAAERTDDVPAREILQKLQDVRPIPHSPSMPSSTHEAAQLEYIFSEWTKLQATDASHASLLSFLQQLHVQKALAVRESLILLIQVALSNAIAAFDAECAKALPIVEKAYVNADALTKLAAFLVAYQGQTNGETRQDRSGLFKTITATLMMSLAEQYRTRGELMNQKLLFRLLSGLMCELSAAPRITPTEHLDLTMTLGRGFTLIAPKYYPALAFAWLSLISHRMFMPVLLRSMTEAAWHMACSLLTKHLEYVGELLKSLDIARGAKDLYRGTLEVLLMLHHDFPEFLAENHFQLLGSIPEHCTQLRSLIVSASPTSSPELLDPFSGGLQLERLEENGRAPVVRGDFEGYLQATGAKEAIDAFLQDESNEEPVLEAVSRAMRVMPKVDQASGSELADETVMDALILYLVTQAESNNQAETKNGKGAVMFSGNSAEGRLLDLLAERLRGEERYHLLGAVCNQLRWPNSHTYYFSYAVFYLFRTRQSMELTQEVQMQIGRVMLERLVAHRPHPWGLMVVTEELLKNRVYGFWDLPFIKGVPEIERMFSSLFQQMTANQRTVSGASH